MLITATPCREKQDLLPHVEALHGYIKQRYGGLIRLDIGVAQLGWWRSNVVEHALTRGADLLFVDSDMVVPPETVDRLLQSTAITGVPYRQRQPPHNWSGPLGATDRVQRVDWCAAGLLYIPAWAIATIATTLGRFSGVRPWFADHMDEETRTWFLEEAAFGRHVRNAGLHMFADPRLACGHASRTHNLVIWGSGQSEPLVTAG